VTIQDLRDDQLRHAIQCGECLVVEVNDSTVPNSKRADVQLCYRGVQLGDSKRALRDELARRDREKR